MTIGSANRLKIKNHCLEKQHNIKITIKYSKLFDDLKQIISTIIR